MGQPAMQTNAAQGATVVGSEAAATPFASNEKVFSRETYDELLSELGEEVMEEAFESFLSETRMRLLDLRSAILETDRKSIARDAHTIKGIAATFGLDRLSSLAKWLEKNADQVGPMEFRRITEELNVAFAAAIEQPTRKTTAAA